MNYAHEYALLAAVAIPFLAIVGINVYLWWGGERGTLLIPSSPTLPSVMSAAALEESMPVGYEMAPATISATPTSATAANDVREREAA
jgi:hypothetical protein